MFTIQLRFDHFTLSGLAALDERRRLKLPDATAFFAYDSTTPTAEVGEGFARLHFDRTQTTATRGVEWASLTPTDVVLIPGSVSRAAHVALDPDMPAERVRELWLAGRP